MNEMKAPPLTLKVRCIFVVKGGCLTEDSDGIFSFSEKIYSFLLIRNDYFAAFTDTTVPEKASTALTVPV